MEEQATSFTDRARQELEANVRWGKYLVIIGYVFTGIVAIGGLIGMLFGSEVSGGVGSVVMVFYLAVAALYYMPIERLNRFVKGCRAAFESGNESALIEGLYGLSRAMRLMVIYTLALLFLYGVMLLFVVVFGLSSALIGA